MAVFGLARSGLAAALSLMAGGARVIAYDDNEMARKQASEKGINIADLSQADWNNLSALVLAPGVPLTHPEPHPIVKLAHQHKVDVIGDVEIFAREVAALAPHARPKIIGITGTNGKSTTTALVGHILRQAGRDVVVCGNIGDAILTTAERMTADMHFVIELSSYQLDLTKSLHCNASALINITEDHIERHGSLAGYARAKMRIFDNQTERDFSVISVDDVPCQAIYMHMLQACKAQLMPVSMQMAMGRGISVLDGLIYDSHLGNMSDIQPLDNAPALIGLHNHQNAAIAFALCKSVGLDSDEIDIGFNSFGGLPHRMERLPTIGHVSLYNDSKATNGHAASVALDALKDIFWICGGRAKMDGLGEAIHHLSHVKKVYLIGEAQDEFADNLSGKTDIQKCGDIETALSAALGDATRSKLIAPNILFSPACASFDQFKDFEERGMAFKRAAFAFSKSDDFKVTA